MKQANPNLGLMAKAILINLRYEELMEKTLRSGASLFLVNLLNDNLQTLAD